MSVTAKFKCISKGEDTYAHSVKLQAVMGDSPENKAFFKATPSGEITLQTVNPAAAAGFQIGKEYHVSFTEAP